MIPDDRLERLLADADLDVVVASSPTNVFHLSGLESLSQDLLGDRAFAVRTADAGGPDIVLPAVDASIVVDSEIEHGRVHTYGNFYLYEDDRLTADDEAVLALKDEHNFGDPIDALLALLEPRVDADTRVAVEQTGLSPSENRHIEDGLPAGDVRTATELLQRGRRLKTEEERDRLRRSVEINQASIRAAVETVEAGTTERELANTFHEQLCSRGAEPLFTVVAFGSHGAYPHARPGDRPLAHGDMIRFDVGCTYANYSSDIARTFAFGEAPAGAAEQYRALDAGMDRTIELLAEADTTKPVFEGTIEYIREAGVFEAFDRNHFGHGIGIEVYDPPTITPEPNPIEPGMVFCVEPPYYELGRGGLQVEDEVVVREDGVDRLSRCAPELPVLE